MYKRKFSNRQLRVIRDFATEKSVLHSGPVGCGKTHSIMIAFGLFCKQMQDRGVTGLRFMLIAWTRGLVEKNMCQVLADNFGSDFKYTSSKKDGNSKDGVIFGQYLFFIGMNDSGSDARIRGMTNIYGAIWDEIALCKLSDYMLVNARVRGGPKDKTKRLIPSNIIPNFIIASCNPDVPTHWLLSNVVNEGLMRRENWTMEDAVYEGAKEYYERLKKLYKGSRTMLLRMLYGKWVAGDKMVYPMFNIKKHVLNNNEFDVDYSIVKKVIIGIDYGSDHPTGLTLAVKTFDNYYIITKSKKLRRTAPSDVVNEVCVLMDYVRSKGNAVSTVYIDPSSVAIKDELIKNNISYIDALNGHDDGIGYISSMFSLEKLFIMSDNEELITEIYGYQYKDSNEKNGRNEVVKIGDDLCDSMRYCIYTDAKLSGD